MNYYDDKITFLEKIFGKVLIKNNTILINNKSFEIKNDVIILNSLAEEKNNDKKLNIESFSKEWKFFNQINKDHEYEFEEYFDLTDVKEIENKIFADFGCGIGRWTKLLNDKVTPDFNILVDYSEAIFVARKNLKKLDNCIFIKADLEQINFKDKVIDFFICLGVLHHIPNGLERSLLNIANSSKKGLCYLYYDFENRKKIFKFIFRLSNYLRLILCNIENRKFRIVITYCLTILLYYPFIFIGKLFKKINIPLNYYIGMEFNRVAQDCYDRFFYKY